MSNVGPPRGMRDVLPLDMERRLALIDTISMAYRSYGYRPIETPALENLTYLESGDGGDNEKLIYKALKRGLTEEDFSAATTANDVADLGLRFDLTVPLARYYASNRANLPTPFRAIQIGPVWRAERPQKGRFRQFVQCDIDILGEAGAIAEAELTRATTRALEALGLTQGTVRINDRRLLIALMESCGVASIDVSRVLIQVDKIDKIGIDGVRNEIEKRWDTASAARVAELLEALEGTDPRSVVAQQVGESEYGIAGLATLDEIYSLIDAAGGIAPFELKFDPTLVRGMGYYTGPIFEIIHPDFSGSIAGGGRYDKMIERISGVATPACGFSIGFERIVEILAADAGATAEVVALLHDKGDHKAAFVEAEKLRASGKRVVMVARVKNRRAQLERLEAEGITEIIETRAE